ncbi:MAG: alpha/beta hydrolase [Dehalococcoidia bacterium]
MTLTGPSRTEPAAQSLTTPDGLSLCLVDFGGAAGPPLLFLHGSFGHARVWDFVVRALPPAQRAFALDLRGHGDSSHDPSGRYPFDRLVEDVGLAVAACGEPPVLAGHSVGSAVAMYYAGQRSETLAGLVLMDIDPQPPEYQVIHLHEAGSNAPKRYDAFERAVARESRVAPVAGQEVHDHLARHGYRHHDGRYVQKFDQSFLATIERWDARPYLPRVSVPALVLRGAESSVHTDEGYQELLRLIPVARGQLIAGASHQLHLDAPTSVAEAIGTFVQQLHNG